MDSIKNQNRSVHSLIGAYNDERIVQSDTEHDERNKLRHGSEWNADDEEDAISYHDAQEYTTHCAETQQTPRIDPIFSEKDQHGEDGHDDKDYRHQGGVRHDSPFEFVIEGSFRRYFQSVNIPSLVEPSISQC
mmetsp:Transcript_24942/g.60049  ORF Transcript_24942/g.60049 Transcript_24942/m.60049 type:complete len:133 (+) Transcript_24942:1744-2142(+)